MAMKGSLGLSYAYIMLVMVQTVYGQIYYDTAAALAPPTGNSPKKVVKTVSSYLVYTCVNGAWIRGKGYATLVDRTTNKVVGNYTTVVDSKGELGTWTLVNSIGDAAESGDSASVVTGRPVASSYVGNSTSSPSQLFEAASHQEDGAAASVSYIQRYNIVGGVPPPKEKCSTRKYSLTVPVTAEFCLWTQDVVPASVPAGLVAPGRLVDGFFGKGFMDYEYNGSSWVASDSAGTLHSLPGSPAIGKFWMKGGDEGWEIYDPNGFILYGKQTTPDVVVTPESCAWSLSAVTSESGSSTTLGPFSHVQMTSTRGGLPPNSEDKPLLASASSVQFSAIFWLYVSG